MSRYNVFVRADLIYEGDSAIAALTTLGALPVVVGEPTIVVYDGATLRGHSRHELEWDASAERANGDPTHYWPKAGERGPFLRKVV